MDPVREAVQAIATSTIDYLKRADDTKYGPIARDARDFVDLVHNAHYEDVLNADLEDGKYADVQDRNGSPYLIFDTDNIPEEVILSNSEVFKALHKRCNGFALEHRRGIAKVMKQDDNPIDEILNRLQGRIPSRFLPVLEEALVLRELEREQNLHQETVYQWRGEIASKYSDRGHDPDDAQNLISLCSTGYLDQGDVFDEMYDKYVANGGKSKSDYQHLMGTYVSKNPFAVFVRSNGRTIDEICSDTKDKLDIIHRWECSPGFVEICGKGSSTYGDVNEVKEKLERNFEGSIKTRHNPHLEQLLVRFEPTVL